MMFAFGAKKKSKNPSPNGRKLHDITRQNPSTLAPQTLPNLHSLRSARGEAASSKL
jgi:hypothetical protein